MANAFVRIAVEQPQAAVSADDLLRLLLDYLASRVGQAGYGTAQLVLTAVLEAFCSRVVQRRRAALKRPAARQQQHAEPSTAEVIVVEDDDDDDDADAEDDAEDDDGDEEANSVRTATTSTTATTLGHIQRVCGIGRDTPNVFTDAAVHGEAMKMLVRIYLGQLKRFEMTATTTTSTTVGQDGDNGPVRALMAETVSLRNGCTYA